MFEKHLEEMRGVQQVILVIRFAVDNLVEQVSWLEEGSRSGNGEVRSI